MVAETVSEAIIRPNLIIFFLGALYGDKLFQRISASFNFTLRCMLSLLFGLQHYLKENSVHLYAVRVVGYLGLYIIA